MVEVIIYVRNGETTISMRRFRNLFITICRETPYIADSPVDLVNKSDEASIRSVEKQFYQAIGLAEL